MESQFKWIAFQSINVPCGDSKPGQESDCEHNRASTSEEGVHLIASGRWLQLRKGREWRGGGGPVRVSC